MWIGTRRDARTNLRAHGPMSIQCRFQPWQLRMLVRDASSAREVSVSFPVFDNFTFKAVIVSVNPDGILVVRPYNAATVSLP